MILKTLVENTSTSPKYKHKHGLCFYIQTQRHKILFDLGPGRLFLENAEKMGIDISDIDTVFISHGHIDHAGALKIFLQNNSTAKIYIRETAFQNHFTKILGLEINVGIDPSFKHHPQIVLTDNYKVIDEELTLFSNVEEHELRSLSNRALYTKTSDGCQLDDFSHEQSLIISENTHKILVAGCSHTGIINIKKKAGELTSPAPSIIISGFHLYNPVSRKTECEDLIREIAHRLDDQTTHYYTCHCTGKKAFAILKEVLSHRITYLSTGSILEI